MPAISKIRFTNIVYEDGNKRYNDEIFVFDGENAAIVLENGGGKTVFIQTALQAIIPHTHMASRKMKETLTLNEPAHIAIEWIISDRPRRYACTAVTLFRGQDALDSYRFVTEYPAGSEQSIEKLPFVKESAEGKRTAEKAEILEYYRQEQAKNKGKTFDTITTFRSYIEENYRIIAKEWDSIVEINSAEGDIEKFFEECTSSQQLFEKLLIPRVEHAMYFNKEETFVEAFAARREGFKIHRRMTKTIEENSAIRKQLENYERYFSKVHQEELHMKKHKEYAKAAAQHYETLLVQYETALEENNQALLQLTRQEEELSQKEAAYEVRLKEQEMLVKKDKMKDAEFIKDSIERRYNQTLQQILSMQVAGEQAIFEKAKAKIEVLQRELENLEESQDIEALQQAREELLRELKGYFMELEENLEKEQLAFTHELNAFNETIKREKTERTILQQEITINEQDIVRYTATIDGFKMQQQQIEKSLFTKREHETILELKKRLEEATTALDAKLIEQAKQLKNVKSQQQEASEKLNALYAKQTAVTGEFAVKKNKVEQFEAAHNVIIERLQTRHHRWAHLTKVYVKQESIVDRLNNEITRYALQKDDKMHKERLALRYVDDYVGMDQFFVDPYIEKQFTTWQKQFDYLEKGSIYITRINDVLNEELDRYWPLTLITTEAEIQKLKDKVMEKRSHLQYPLRILSIDEAKNYVEQPSTQTTELIMPKHWAYYQDPNEFHNWKNELVDEANLIINEREEAEIQLEQWRLLKSDFMQFLTTYSEEAYHNVSSEKNALQNELNEIAVNLKKTSVAIETYEKQQDVLQEQLKNDRETYGKLQEQLTKTYDYDQLSRQITKRQSEVYVLQNQVEKDKRAFERMTLSIEKMVEEAEALKDSLSQFQIDKYQQLEGNLYYKQSKAVERPIFTTKTLNLLTETFESVDRQLKEQSLDRRLIEQEIRQHRANWQQSEERVEQLLGEGIEILPIAFLPEDYRMQLAQLTEERNEMKRLLEEKIEAFEARKVTYVSASALYKAQLKTHEEGFGHDVLHFDAPLNQVQELLTTEKNQLQQLRNTLEKELAIVSKQVKQMSHTIHDYQLLDAKFDIQHPALEKHPLTEEELLELTYHPIEQRSAIEKRLEAGQKQYDQAIGSLEKEKEQFHHFCVHTIKDSKLRDYTIEGLRVHKTYEEITLFSEKMLERIETAIQYAEATMKKNDEELTQFIHRMYTHIANVVGELMLIPRNTRVKTAEGSKEIFKFDIPEWQEQDAKEAIRTYVERLGQRLEQHDFKDQLGLEDAQKVKKEIRDTLNTQQLLSVLTGHQKLKASCRKVTNDLSVSSRFSSWEQSNKWSGGEKWSKNMSLFLGILKYIAVKTFGADEIKSKKRSRTVIVDNPFGKASSDHVLQPVFFIAEQLGFQMIALTAHAEGKFLSDYFPVIYSCRLRQAIGSSRQIIETQKEIQKAFFEDNDPDTLSRLGEQEQLNLELEV